MNTIVFFILGWASFASADSSIGGYSYETPGYETPWVDQNSGWHPPQQIDRSSLANLLRTNARQAITDPMMMVGAGGAALNAVYTTVATAGVAKTVVAANGRIDASNKRISKVETRSSNSCAKVNSILALAYPTADWTDTSTKFTNANAKVPLSCKTKNPVSKHIAPEQTCLAKTGHYQIGHGVAFTGSTKKITGLTSVGLADIPRTVMIKDGGATQTALSIEDFNTFRLRTAAAINELDDKIRDLLAISSLTC